MQEGELTPDTAGDTPAPVETQWGQGASFTQAAPVEGVLGPLCQICAQLWQREKLWVRLRWRLLWDMALVLVSIPLRKRGTPKTPEVCTHPRAAQGHGEAGCSHHDAP